MSREHAMSNAVVPAVNDGILLIVMRGDIEYNLSYE